MPLLNKDLFLKDPSKAKIPNDGVAKVGTPETTEQWDVLRWELGSFVCEGEYARGLDRILTSFLSNLSEANQPGTWVSGFYGSGKSHFVRVLEYLWRNPELPGGQHARDLVTLPNEIEAQLVELTTQSRRAGGLWTAAGTLAAGKSNQARLAFLSVLFGSAKLPEQYPFARFTLWAAERGYLEHIAQTIEDAGLTFGAEVQNLYVSPFIAQALVDVDSTLSSPKEARELLIAQFRPNESDITDGETFAAMNQVLRAQSNTDDKLPLTLIVLDEMQQYLGDDTNKAITVQDIAEGCASQFQSRVLVVATGQSAMGATASLQRLQARFPVEVSLSDTDVESVVRNVILRKRPEHQAELQAALDKVAPEIDRQLGGTQIEAKAADKQDLVADYPLLPTRRRFWELALRSIDKAGKGGVLRTQLKIVHEAARAVANEPIGIVVGGDFLYHQQATGMQQTGVLLKEIDELIRALRPQGADGELKARICALIFLISQLPMRVSGSQTGIRASVPVLADLLVADLADGAVIRKRVPELLEELVLEGRVLKVDDEYLLQTEEGAEWEKDYRSRLNAIRDDAARIQGLRNERLVSTVDEALGNLRIPHGESRIPRVVRPHWGEEAPPNSEGEVPVWIRDEWSTTEALVKRSAAEAGDESPTVFVFLPRRDATAIRDALASMQAAKETVDQRPVPQTEEGKTAAAAMRTRVETSSEQLAGLLADVVGHARVFQGGGTELAPQGGLRETVQTAAENSLVRLFPKFKQADNSNWARVIIKARDGAPDALAEIGHAGEPLANTVCKEIHAAISAGGTTGAELTKQFIAGQYGWPQDAVRGALLVLVAAGHVRATLDGAPVAGPKELLPTQIGRATLYKEDDPPTMQQRMRVRKLLVDLKIAYENGQEAASAPALLQHLKELAQRAGGDPPLPPAPDPSDIDALLGLAGNQQLRAIADDADSLGVLATTWAGAETAASQRLTKWDELQRLIGHVRHFPVASEVEADRRAIVEGRLLLDEPNPVLPLRAKVADAARQILLARVHELVEARAKARADLQGWEPWSRIDDQQREAFLRDAELESPAEPQVSSDEDLLAALDHLPLQAWADRISLVEPRLDELKQSVLKKLEPQSITVKLPSGTVKTPDELTAYLAEVRAVVEEHLDGDTPIMVL